MQQKLVFVLLGMVTCLVALYRLFTFADGVLNITDVLLVGAWLYTLFASTFVLARISQRSGVKTKVRYIVAVGIVPMAIAIFSAMFTSWM